MSFSQLDPMISSQWLEPRWVYCGNDTNLPPENEPQVVVVDTGYGFDVCVGVQWLRGGPNNDFAKWYYHGHSRVFRQIVAWLYLPPLIALNKTKIAEFREFGTMALTGNLLEINQ